jgi:hypothetical protein
MTKSNTITSFSNLTFYPMTAPNIGTIAEGMLTSGYQITVTGGNTGQHADGIENFLVEVKDIRGKLSDEPKIITKRNMHSEELAILIEHHYRNQYKRRRTQNYNRPQNYTRGRR